MMLIGIIGAPNKGKSTFFKAATLAEVEIEDRPFVTIKPNRGTGYVKIECVDKFFNEQCNPRLGFCLNHYRFIPFELIDVAGLVPGASEGKGLGSQFLDDLNEADALIQIIDISGNTDSEGNRVSGYDPEDDIKFLENELDRWYLRIIKKGWERFSRTVIQENLDVKKAIAKQLSGLRVNEAITAEVLKKLNLSLRPSDWKESDLLNLARELRKKTKPMVIVANKIDVKGASQNYEILKGKYDIIACSAEIELALREAAKKKVIEYVPGENNFKIVNNDLSENHKKALEFMKKFLDSYGNTGVQEVLNKVVFDVLKCIAIYPGGVKTLADKNGNILPDCFLMLDGSTALDFAYKLHTDFGKNFIRAIDVKTKRTVGKEHKLKNKDVIEIVANR
ncbi:redox-regulated ATPase YchF [Candidatus Woesearchaeota archaeon]|nr:redox-regulated ATPase YchF [Candidatus Woesearchaeota archaeon]